MLHDQLMAELKTREGSRCNCCPYGYHIHLDFVQFCDSLKAQAARSNMDELRNQCRERRRQRKSLQAYLGMLDSESTKQDEIIAATRKSEPLCTKPLPSAPPPDLLASNDETLNEVFRNFEDVLSSHEKGLGNGHLEDDGRGIKRDLQKVDLLQNAPKYADSATVSPDAEQRKAKEILDMVFGPSRSRSGSTSSISSLSTNSSSAVPDQLLGGGFRGQRQHHHHQLAGGVYRGAAAVPSLAAASSREQATSPNHPLGVNRAALTNVREMMATSLERIRQLEEEAKAIPLLQAKLKALKEEKRLLMQQLQSKPSQLSQHSIGIGDNHILGSSTNDTVAGDGLDSLIQELENQVGLPKAALSESRVQTKYPDRKSVV